MTDPHDALWRSLGYNTRHGDFTVPCHKQVQVSGRYVFLGWTRDSFGTYTLSATSTDGRVEVQFKPRDLTRVLAIEVRLLRAIDALVGVQDGTSPA